MPSLSSSSPSSSTQRAESPTIARYAPAKSPDIDPYNGSPSRDWCNSFWGVGDAGVNVLFARMRGSMQSMRELEGFWKERAAIEEEYAKRLLGLAKMVIGKEETGELRSALDMLIFETEVQGTAHLQFASLVRNELLAPTNERVEKQNADEAQLLSPLEARFKTKSSAEAAVSKAREKYESNCLRLASYTQQMSVNTAKDVERLQMKIRKSRETVESNERELSIAVNAIREATVRWQEDWKEFCDISQDVEEERMDFVKDAVWGYANAVSTLCVSDDQSCERIRVALDQVDAYQDIEAFVEEYGTGNSIPEPPSWVPFSSSSSNTNTNAKTTNGSSTRPARFARISNRPPPPPLQEEMLPKQWNSRDTPPPTNPRTRKDSTPSVNVAINGNGNSQPNGIIARHHKSEEPPLPPPPPPPPPPTSPPTTFTQDARRKSSQPSLRRVSGPLPQQPGGTRSQTPAPQPPPLPTQGQGGGDADVDPDRILFFVQALYDYTATIDEEFDFEAGDIIAVKATPDDGWWSGELLDEARRIPGRHIFPSNFITLF
ncbi:SH3 domain-containing protein [Mycena amicta]|nr:SH3 domain-containing protein [Mycena amicta]